MSAGARWFLQHPLEELDLGAGVEVVRRVVEAEVGGILVAELLQRDEQRLACDGIADLGSEDLGAVGLDFAVESLRLHERERDLDFLLLHGVVAGVRFELLGQAREMFLRNSPSGYSAASCALIVHRSNR